MNKIRILFIGAGQMAQAMIEGIRKKNEFTILAANNGNDERLEMVKEKYGVEITKQWKEAVNKVDIIILAIPPEAYQSILADLANLIDKQLVLTIAGGIGPSYLEARLPKGTPVAWIMPNTAAKIGQSITLYTYGQYVTQEHSVWIEKLNRGIGEYERVSEKQIHELTSVTGSAPAFMYRFAEVLEKITVESGVAEEQARKLVSQMLAGSAAMLQRNEDPALLARQVATPGGSTEAGLQILDDNHFDVLIRKAIDACREKAGLGINTKKMLKDQE